MEQIICIFCGQKADIVPKNNVSKAICGFCNKETEPVEYRKMVDQWLEKFQVKEIDLDKIGI